jgi:hypothetical protein
MSLAEADTGRMARDLSGRLRTALAVAVAAVVVTALPAAATITSSDLPSKATVKEHMNGTGTWRASFGSARPIGASPADCRSDLQMLDPTERKARGYSGPQPGRPASVLGEVLVEVYRYASASAASDAVRRNGTYPDRCPRVREWTCTECDGVATVWRDRVAMPRVGVQSMAWRFHGIDNFKHNGWTVVARRGSTVVRVSTGRVHMPDDGPFRYPQMVSKDRAERIARLALRTAMPG